MLRTHTCGELNINSLNQEVELSAWVDSYRNLGSLIFIDLRDKYGITQVRYDLNSGDEKIVNILKSLRNEWVVWVKGTVVAREGNVNNQMASGEIEIDLKDVKVLNESLTPPFNISEDKSVDVNESLRLQYRYLDLRKKKNQEMLQAKDQMIRYIRNYFHSLNFTEIQTPILANSSPEGARDFLIPSRIYPGNFYALPQAPQQFKQLLMVAGVDKYFQIAPCFRDEDPRMDRHYGEFYQLDMEMSFVEQDDIFNIMEPLMKGLVSELSDKKFTALNSDASFVRIPWLEAMNVYGSDKPDLRFDMKIVDISEILRDTDFTIFADNLKKGGVIKALAVKEGASMSRKEIDLIIEEAKKKGLGGLSYITLKEGSLNSSLLKFLGDEKVSEIVRACQLQDGDIVFIASDNWKEAVLALGHLRLYIADKLNLRDDSLVAFAWIVDFPMYEYSEIEEGRIDFAHNPFSMPQASLEDLDTKNPLSIYAYQFDLALNGFEVSSGAIRNHNPEIMYKVFELAGYSKEEVDHDFSAMIKAFSYGAPPHGGNAPGIDRLLMILKNWNSIRDIYAFPKDSKGKDLMTGAPAKIDDKKISELKIKLV